MPTASFFMAHRSKGDDYAAMAVRRGRAVVDVYVALGWKAIRQKTDEQAILILQKTADRHVALLEAQIELQQRTIEDLQRAQHSRNTFNP